MKRLRNYFVSGLLFWVPFGLTIVVIRFFIDLIDGIVPAKYQPEVLLNLSTDIPGSGAILVVLVIFLTGLLITNFIGRSLVDLWERLLNRIPGFRGIYNALKQLSSTVLSTSNNSFKHAFLIEYPRRGLWTIAFQSGDYRGEAEANIGEEIINLYVPTTPNPTSGFFIMMAKKEAIPLEMSVDEAFKLVISTGVVAPNEAAEK